MMRKMKSVAPSGPYSRGPAPAPGGVEGSTGGPTHVQAAVVFSFSSLAEFRIDLRACSTLGDRVKQ